MPSPALARTRDALARARASASRARNNARGKMGTVETAASVAAGAAAAGVIAAQGFDDIAGYDPRLFVGAAGVAASIFAVPDSSPWAGRIAGLSLGIMAPAIADLVQDYTPNMVAGTALAAA